MIHAVVEQPHVRRWHVEHGDTDVRARECGGYEHSFKSTAIQQVLTSSSSDIKNNKIITTIYYGNNKLLDTWWSGLLEP